MKEFTMAAAHIKTTATERRARVGRAAALIGALLLGAAVTAAGLLLHLNISSQVRRFSGLIMARLFLTKSLFIILADQFLGGWAIMSLIERSDIVCLQDAGVASRRLKVNVTCSVQSKASRFHFEHLAVLANEH